MHAPYTINQEKIASAKRLRLRVKFQLCNVFMTQLLFHIRSYSARGKVVDRMSLFQYFKRQDGLPTAKETGLTPHATAEANRAVEKVLADDVTIRKGKRRYTTDFSSEDRAKIGKFAVENGNAKAVKHFKSTYQHLGESTVRFFKKRYLDGLAEKRKNGEMHPAVAEIPVKKQGRPLLLGDLDVQVQQYIRSLRSAGAPVSTQIVQAAAEGIVTSKDRTLLAEYGGNITLSRGWALSLLQRMGFVKRKAATEKKQQLSESEFLCRKSAFLKSIGSLVHAHNIPPDLIFNWDQTGICLVPTGSYTMEQRGATRVEIACLNDKRQITATLAVTMSGKFLPFQLLYEGKTERCHPSYQFPAEIDVWHSPKHWSNGELTRRFIEKVIIPYVQSAREINSLPSDYPALAVFDCFSGHSTDEVTDVLETNHIYYVYVPAHCTDRLQPLDISVNKAVKDHLKRQFRAWYAEQVSRQMDGERVPDDIKVDTRLSAIKTVSAKWIVSMYDYLRSKPDIVTKGFRKAGIIHATEGDPFEEFGESEEECDDPFSDQSH